ncbi:MAG: tetratricopeptide repeat protein [Spirochaetaceae bacterium]|jgi:tetratricopeptide (TPR) repeat protein|nr:tetratricopeptide repeat protein [Spirochaetaceae bacterium]
MATAFEEAIRLYNMKRWDSALQNFQSIDSSAFSTEEKTELAYYMGLCYTKMERYNDAVIYLEQVVTGDAGPLRVCQCRLSLAYIYMITERPRMAEFELDKLIKGGFRSVQIFTMMAYAAWMQKQDDRAVEMYKEAIGIDPNNTTAMNGLGFLLVESGRDIKRGLELCKKAVDKRPHNAAYLDSLGWAYYKTGELAEARQCLRRALDLAPRHKDISSHMKILLAEAS